MLWVRGWLAIYCRSAHSPAFRPASAFFLGALGLLLCYSSEDLVLFKAVTSIQMSREVAWSRWPCDHRDWLGHRAGGTKEQEDKAAPDAKGYIRWDVDGGAGTGSRLVALAALLAEIVESSGRLRGGFGSAVGYERPPACWLTQAHRRASLGPCYRHLVAKLCQALATPWTPCLDGTGERCSEPVWPRRPWALCPVKAVGFCSLTRMPAQAPPPP